MSCVQCLRLCIYYRISSPDDLTYVIKVANQAVEDGVLVVENDNIEYEGFPSLEALANGAGWNDVVSFKLHCTNCLTKFEFGAETYHGSGGQWTPIDHQNIHDLYREISENYTSAMTFTSESQYNLNIRNASTYIPPTSPLGFGHLPDKNQIKYAKAVIGQPKQLPSELIIKIIQSAIKYKNIRRIYFCHFFVLLQDSHPKPMLIVEYDHPYALNLECLQDDVSELSISNMINLNTFKEWDCHLSDICCYSIYDKNDGNILHNQMHNKENNSNQTSVLVTFLLIIFGILSVIIISFFMF